MNRTNSLVTCAPLRAHHVAVPAQGHMNQVNPLVFKDKSTISQWSVCTTRPRTVHYSVRGGLL